MIQRPSGDARSRSLISIKLRSEQLRTAPSAHCCSRALWCVFKSLFQCEIDLTPLLTNVHSLFMNKVYSLKENKSVMWWRHSRTVKNKPINLAAQCDLSAPSRCLNHSALVAVALMGNWMWLGSADSDELRFLEDLISGYKAQTFCLNYTAAQTLSNLDSRHVSLCTCHALLLLTCQEVTWSPMIG